MAKIKATAKQRQFFEAVLLDEFYEQIGYGGARGGGKTWASAMAMAIRRLKYPGTRGLMLRQTQSAADQNLGEEIRKVLTQLGVPTGLTVNTATWREQKKQWLFPNGSYIQLGYCKSETDWERYQGQEYMDIAFEEATQFKEKAFLNIIGSNRTGRRAGTGGKVWLTCNPGNAYDEWVQRRFIEPSTRDRRTLWIKALLRDNYAMLENDPGYRDRNLAKQPPWRLKQWEDGDWDAVEGQFFDVDPRMIREQEIPYWADVYAGVDAGFWPSAFAAVWVAKWRDGAGKMHLHIIREVKKHKLNITQQATEALAMEKVGIPNHRIKARFADPAAWKRTETDGGMSASTAYGWAQKGFIVTAAYSNARAAGWLLTRTLIEEQLLTIDPSCIALLREMQEAQHDTKSDDIKEGTDDHLLDALRYVLVSIFAGSFPNKEEDPYKKIIKKKSERDNKIVIMRG